MAESEENINGVSLQVVSSPDSPQPVYVVSSPVASPSISGEVIPQHAMSIGPPDTAGFTIKWCDSAVISLIHLYKENKYMFNSGDYKKKDIWCLITEIMKDLGDIPASFTWNQVEQKWKNMTKKYRDCVDYNNRFVCGRPKTCSYYAQLAEVYEYTAKLPDTVGSASPAKHVKKSPPKRNSISKRPISAADFESEYTDNDLAASPMSSWKGVVIKQERDMIHVYTESDTDSPPPPKRQKAGKKNFKKDGSDSGEVVELLSSIRDVQIKHHKEVMQMMQKMHKDQMKLLTSLVDVMKKQL